MRESFAAKFLPSAVDHTALKPHNHTAVMPALWNSHPPDTVHQVRHGGHMFVRGLVQVVEHRAAGHMTLADHILDDH